ncbi:MAG: Pvc16 family protein [Clostridia bacterium]|nr:Pvc16 family protein [Clostridia bacterium]
MIRYLSKTLGELLKSELEAECGEINVVYYRPKEPPDNLETSTFNLFLYDIRENVELRSNEPIVQRRNGQGIVLSPPLRVACSYLVTAWPANKKEEEDMNLEEQRLLSLALQVFTQYPKIPEDFLQGELANQELPLPMVTFQADGLKNPAEFWSMTNSKMRAAFTITVTISLPVIADRSAPLVKQVFNRIEPAVENVGEAFVQIAGRVVDDKKAGIPEAIVDILGTKLRGMTDKEGVYTFPRVPPGMYTLRAVAMGFEVKTQKMFVPGKPDEYTITLKPL